MTQVQLGMLIAFITAVVGSLLLTPIVVREAAARRLFENPRGGERLPRRPVSRLGGVAIFFAAVPAVLVAIYLGALDIDPERQRFLLGLLLGGTIVFGLGLYDDLRGARVRTKLAVQLVAAIIVFAMGTRVEVMTLGETVGVQIGMLSLPLTVLWIIGVTNAFNLIDGLDGLATGIGLVVLGAVMVAAHLLGNSDVLLVSLVLVGAMLGFLRYNISPARIFLGDSGSLFIGFMLAVLSIHGSLKSTTAVMVAVPVFALAVPLLDAAVALARRWLRGSPLFGPDSRHIHHRLLASGLTPRSASAVLWIVAAVLAVYGLSVAFAPPPVLLGVAIGGGLLVLALVLYGVRRLDYVEFAEAMLAISRGVRGVRKVIHDQIHAREIAVLIREATTLEELNAILGRNASRFGFFGMAVNYDMELDMLWRPDANHADAPRLWKMDHPVTRGPVLYDDQFTFRIWCDVDVQYRPYGAVRVARILAPVIEKWIKDSDGSLRMRNRTRRDRRRRDQIAFATPIDGQQLADSQAPLR